MQIVCTACQYASAVDSFVHPCGRCGEPVEVVYEPGEIAPDLALAGGGRLHGILTDFAAVLPHLGAGVVSLGEGGSPMLEVGELAERLGLPELHLKNEASNPTGSFKDRGSAVALSWALGHGFASAGTVSSGNMAGSVAAYAARAQMPCVVLVPAHMKPEKLFTIGVYGPDLIRVAGDYGELYRRAIRLARAQGIYLAVSDDPWRVEGQKTIAYEIVRDLGGMPDYVFVAVSSGGHMAAIIKGFAELAGAGIIPRIPAVIGVQSTGCNPIARAFQGSADRVTRLKQAITAAHAIANPDPPSGSRLLRSIRAAGTGAVIAVDDEDLRRAQLLLAAGAGAFVQMESAAALAGAIVYATQGRFTRNDRIVLVATGNGLKDPAAFADTDFGATLVALDDLDSLPVTPIRR